jgi:hypothetical protein
MTRLSASEWARGLRRTDAQRAEAARLVTVLSDPAHTQLGGKSCATLDQIGYILDPPPAPLSLSTAAAAAAAAATASAHVLEGEAERWGLPATWVRTWMPLEDRPGVLVPADGVDATLAAVARQLRNAAAAERAAAAAAVVAASVHDGAGLAPPPALASPSPLDAAVTRLQQWRWAGTTSTKLAYLLTALAAHPDAKTLVFTSHHNTLYAVCHALTNAGIRHLWYNTQLVRSTPPPKGRMRGGGGGARAP